MKSLFKKTTLLLIIFSFSFGLYSYSTTNSLDEIAKAEFNSDLKENSKKENSQKDDFKFGAFDKELKIAKFLNKIEDLQISNLQKTYFAKVPTSPPNC